MTNGMGKIRVAFPVALVRLAVRLLAGEKEREIIDIGVGGGPVDRV
jgi:hypothetical protein